MHLTDVIGMGMAATGKFIATCNDKTELLVWSLKGDVRIKFSISTIWIRGRADICQVLAKLDTGTDPAVCSAWENFHHVFSQAWLESFNHRQRDPTHYANQFKNPTVITRGNSDFDDFFDEIDNFEHSGSDHKTR